MTCLFYYISKFNPYIINDCASPLIANRYKEIAKINANKTKIQLDITFSIFFIYYSSNVNVSGIYFTEPEINPCNGAVVPCVIRL